MNKPFDIEKMSRCTPYKVPDGFYESLRKEVEQELFDPSEPQPMVETPRKSVKVHPWRTILTAAMAVAASIALLLIFWPSGPLSDATLAQTQWKEICTAYDNLSEEDQDFYLEACSEDIFMTEQEMY